MDMSRKFQQDVLLSILAASLFSASVYADHSTFVFDFESLQLGDLEGQGGWLAPIGRNEFNVVPSTSSGNYVGGKAVQPNGWQEGWVYERGYMMSEAVATIQLQSRLGYPIDEPISVHFDVLFGGRADIWVWLSDSKTPTNQSPAFGVGTYGSYAYRYGGTMGYRNGYDQYIDVEAGDWLRLTMTLDASEQTVRFTENNLTTGQLDPRTFQSGIGNTISLTNIASYGTPPFDPRTWDQVNIGWRHNPSVLIDNITIPTPIPEPGTCTMLVSCLSVIPFRASRI